LSHLHFFFSTPLLAPGGTIVDDGAEQSKFNVFDSEGSDEDIKAYASVSPYEKPAHDDFGS
jgi:hypothetical protein